MKEYKYCNECKVAFEKNNPTTGFPYNFCPKCGSEKIEQMGDGYFRETKGVWFNPSQRRRKE